MKKMKRISNSYEIKELFIKMIFLQKFSCVTAFQNGWRDIFKLLSQCELQSAELPEGKLSFAPFLAPGVKLAG